MSENCSPSIEKFYLDAKNKLEQKDFVDFIWNLSRAEFFAQNEKELLAKVMFLKVHGFFRFNEYEKALSFVDEAISCNTGRDAIKLKNYKGVMLGYTGKLEEARELFTALLAEIQDVDMLVETYLNLTWINSTMYSLEKDATLLDEVKKYLDLANAHLDEVDSKTKGKILDNYSFYYFSLGNYEKAIEVEETALEHFPEKDLPKIYNNLAAMYLEFDKVEGMNCVSIKGREYIKKAELLGDKYHLKMEVAKAFYNQAMAQLQEDQLFAALDTLYLAFEYFKNAQALSLAFDCLLKINEITTEYKVERLKALKESLKDGFKGSSLFDKI